MPDLHVNYWKDCTYHSSDLSNGCARAVWHRHRGEIDGLTEGALFTGQLNDVLMTMMHTHDGLIEGPLPMDQALKEVDEKNKAENRYYSESVKTNRDDIAQEVLENAESYRKRLGDYFSKCTILGTQIPMSLSIPLGDDEVKYATHNDIAYRSPDGQLMNADWKWKQEFPTAIEISRSPQGVLMHRCIVDGQIKVGEHWITVGEPVVTQFVDSKNFCAYKTSRKNEDGTYKFKRGDERPLSKLVVSVEYSEDKADTQRSMLLERPMMARAGVFPMTVGPHCQFCPSLKWCTRFTGDTEP